MSEGFREVQLSQGKVALVDEEDYERVSQFKWTADKSTDGKRWYARRPVVNEKTQRKTSLRLHVFILGAFPGMDIDHRNGNGLDCRKDNLRKATRSQNMGNIGKQKNNTSGFEGIHLHKKNNSWRAQIKFNGKKVHIGCYSTKEEAAKAYDEKAKSLFGEFSKLNFEEET